MQFTFEPAEQSCFVTEVTPSSSMRCEIPVPTNVVLDGLKTLLFNPEQREHAIGAVMFDRLRDGLRLNVGSFTYTFRYAHIFPMVMDT